MHQPEHPHDQLLVLRSKLAQSVLTDSWFDSRFGGFVAQSESARIAWRILRASPAALRHALRSLEDNAPNVPITGGGGFLTALLGSLQDDFLRFPSLLLEPGLIDDIHEASLIDEEDWKRLRIRQIAVYHEVYKDDAVLEQWAIPSEWELQAEQTEAVPSHEVTLSFIGKQEQIGNPLLQLAAARRLKLPLKLTSTPSVRIAVQSDAGPAHLHNGEPIRAIVVGALKETSTIMTGAVPAHFEAEDDGAFSLVAKLDVPPSEFDWTQPFRCHIRLEPPSEDEQGHTVRPLTSTLTLQLDNLDSSQAALMLEMAEITGAVIHFPWAPDDAIIGSPATTDRLTCFRNLCESPEERAFLVRLSELQHFLGERIPVPLSRLHDDLKETLLQADLRTKKQAEILWHRLMGKIAKMGKPAVSTFIVEFYQNDILRDRQYLDAVYGCHMPRLRMPGGTGGCIGTSGDEFDRVLTDPSSSAAFVRGMRIRLSPQATVEVLKGKPRESNGHKHVDVTALNEFVAHEPVQCRTEVSFYWRPVYETPWESVTPFVVELREYNDQERWLLESHHFTEVAVDPRRAYVAAVEGFRIEPDHPQLRVSMGWSAFVVGRVREALAITKPVLQSGDIADQCVASANVGLFQLKLAAITPDPASEIVAARQAYERFGSLLASLAEDQAEAIRADVLSDLRTWSDSLHPEASLLLDELAPRSS